MSIINIKKTITIKRKKHSFDFTRCEKIPACPESFLGCGVKEQWDAGWFGNPRALL